MSVETLWIGMGCLFVGYMLGSIAGRSGGQHAAPREHVPPDKVDPVVLELIREGQKLQAIKQYRTLYRVDLKQAKDAVDALEQRID